MCNIFFFLHRHIKNTPVKYKYLKNNYISTVTKHLYLIVFPSLLPSVSISNNWYSFFRFLGITGILLLLLLSRKVLHFFLLFSSSSFSFFPNRSLLLLASWFPMWPLLAAPASRSLSPSSTTLLTVTRPWRYITDFYFYILAVLVFDYLEHPPWLQYHQRNHYYQFQQPLCSGEHARDAGQSLSWI